MTSPRYCRLFLYGSLLPGMAHHDVISPYLTAGPIPGSVRGRLIDAGPYPALWLGGGQEAIGRGDRVRGMWAEVELAAWPVLDAFEGFAGTEEANDYDRVWVADADEAQTSGWVYVWETPRGYPFAASNWWPDVVVRQMR
ncbi:gamma-glutamylcyclotransferase family protein [Cohnella nanjingensis]|uniref:Gamma-glutamylcyclotransferase n=1 Tax=Cohnella nanjingensis TaxID=1387779 RepID=A0A7X0RLZ0_9BACL|nr:gamma-glutamylcyclotransferase family protein [Cohnella nanjingensis]MBB6669733.1 gamma-glutamylcyclotransferase [Cohnella nanjingensis]